MNLYSTKKAWAILSVAMLSLSVITACTKEKSVEGTLGKEEQTEHQSAQIGLRSLDLNFEIDASVLDSLSDESRLRALPITADANNHEKPSVNAVIGSTVTGHIYILRRAKNSTANGDQQYLTVLKNKVFTITGQTTNKRLGLKLNVTSAPVKGYVSDADAANYDWYMSVMLGGQAQTDNSLVYEPIDPSNLFITKMKADGATLERKHVDNTVINVPYGFGWTKFSFSNMQALSDNKVKPLGYYVRFNIKNALETSVSEPYIGHYRIYKISAQSNKLFTKAKYVPTLDGAKISAGKVTWENGGTTLADNTVWTTNLVQSQLLEINKHANSEKQYFWLWFGASDPTAVSDLKLQVEGEGAEGRTAKKHNFAINLSPLTGHEEGSTVRRTLKLVSKPANTTDGVHPMLWPAYGDVKQYAEGQPSIEETTQTKSGIGGLKPGDFVNQVNNTDRSAVWFGANNSIASVRPNENRYVPTVIDWYTVLPYSYWDTKNAISKEIWVGSGNPYPWFKTSTLGTNPRTVNAINRTSDPNKTYNANDIYQHTEYFQKQGDNVLVMIRFTNATKGIGNKFRSVWRYTFENGKGLKVEAVQLGEATIENQTGLPLPDLGATSYGTLLGRVAQTAWWTTAAAQKRVLTHYFPIGGAPDHTTSAFYVTSTMYDQTRPVYMSIDANGVGSYLQATSVGSANRTNYNKYRAGKVRYFKFNPEQP